MNWLLSTIVCSSRPQKHRSAATWALNLHPQQNIGSCLGNVCKNLQSPALLTNCWAFLNSLQLFPRDQRPVGLEAVRFQKDYQDQTRSVPFVWCVSVTPTLTVMMNPLNSVTSNTTTDTQTTGPDITALFVTPDRENTKLTFPIKYCHITPIFKCLHRLPVSFRFDFKILFLMVFVLLVCQICFEFMTQPELSGLIYT